MKICPHFVLEKRGIVREFCVPNSVATLSTSRITNNPNKLKCFTQKVQDKPIFAIYLRIKTFKLFILIPFWNIKKLNILRDLFTDKLKPLYPNILS